jgi:hypothetical protein
MNAQWRRAGVVFLAAALVLGTADAARGQERRAGVFAPLAPGQRVKLEEKDGRYVISAVLGVTGTHTVNEIAPDFIAVQEIGGLTETRIPVFAVKAVLVTRTGR